MKRWFLVLAMAFALPAAAEPNGILLVAKPGLPDPNFREAVILVTRAHDASTVGVILNRPTKQRLADLVPGWAGAGDFAEPLYAGGPVMRQVVVALFHSDDAPKDAAFQVLPNVYLSMHPRNIERLLAQPHERVRLYAGFSGWAPQQLEAEINTGSWFALRATESVIFRKDTSGLWRELVARARGARTATEPATHVAAR